MLFKDCGRTDGQTDDDDGHRVITIAHLEPSAQGELKSHMPKTKIQDQPVHLCSLIKMLCLSR